MGVMKESLMQIEEQLLDAFRLGQITREEFITLHEQRLNYSRADAEQYADETADFLEDMARS